LLLVLVALAHLEQTRLAITVHLAVLQALLQAVAVVVVSKTQTAVTVVAVVVVVTVFQLAV
jgi:hypothetical protein